MKRILALLCLLTTSVALAVRLGAIPPPEDGIGGADVSIDAYGSRAVLAASVASLRPRGRHVQVGLTPVMRVDATD